MAVSFDSLFAAALLRLDARLGREIARLRARYHLSLDEFRGLYVSDEQVDSLLTAAGREEEETADAGAPLDEGLGADSRWRHVAETFDLSPLDKELILIATAPEIDLKYETLYAYLNDDVTRKWPTGDLARRLLSPRASRDAILAALAPGSTLRRSHLVEAIDPPAGRPSALNTGFAVHASLSRFLQRVSLGAEDSTSADSPRDLPLSDKLAGEIDRLGQISADGGRSPVIVFEGADATARRCATRLLARGAARPLKVVNLATLRGPSSSGAAVATLALEAQLEAAIVAIEGLEMALDADGRLLPDARGMLAGFADLLLILMTNSGFPWAALVGDRRARVVSLATPEYVDRLHLWRAALDRAQLSVSDADSRFLADRYAFTATEIVHATDAARETRHLKSNGSDDIVCLRDAARAVARQRGGQRTALRSATFGWDDLVLPPHSLARLKELAAAIRLRHIVFGEWAFGRKSDVGTGVKALFAGASGTGKTMAAGVIARELGLDLAKIDLAATVSKYIGETEKNLDRIFSGASAGGSLLFFDEADALFGKRSEVKEAHDRYANIEVAYLLQKLEEHDGAVILATNFRRNIDEAFLRRLHYVVDFPQPDAALRERLWRGMFPKEAPLADDVDFAFLARQFEFAGGDIRNVVVDAAFLAADGGTPIGMSHLINAVVRQLTKQGKAPSPVEFQRYFDLVP